MALIFRHVKLRRTRSVRHPGPSTRLAKCWLTFHFSALYDLEEILALPDSLRVIGVAALDSARILGWTSDRVVLLNAFRQHGPQVLRNSWPVLAARVEADSSIEVVDAAGVRLHHLLSGAFTRTVTFPDGIRYLSAARSHGLLLDRSDSADRTAQVRDETRHIVI